MHGPQAAALKVGVDDVLLLRLGVGNTGLKDAAAATIFAFELGVAAGVVAIFDDVGGLAAGAVVGDGGLDHGGHQRDQGQSILMYHVGLRYYRCWRCGGGKAAFSEAESGGVWLLRINVQSAS